MAAARTTKSSGDQSAGETKNQPVPEGDKVAAEIQRATDQAQAQGFFGVETDPTPNANYTIAGVTSGAPTPETDPEAAAAARRASTGQ